MPSNTKANPIIKVLFVLLIIYLSINLVNQQQLIENKNSELAGVQAKIAAEVKLSEELRNEKDMLMSDESLERIARDKLGMVKPGERVFVDLNRQ
ncbi:MAG: septum formation initiator family protein [Oscillospiraceae bacterium]|nr:septum formation initiator family protein [Oscillospiraceae bacterium]